MGVLSIVIWRPAAIQPPAAAKDVNDGSKAQRQLRYNWNDIVYFLEVARQRNLVRAARS